MDVFVSVSRELRELWKDGRGASLVVIALGWSIMIGTRMIYPILLPHLRSTFDLTLAVSGLLLTILWFGSAIGQLPGGILADRYSERAVMTVSPILVALSLVVVIVAPDPVLLFVATGLVGFGQSLYPVARITILSHIYPDRLGSALGVTMATGDLGQTVLPPIAGVLAIWFTWQFGFGFMLPLLLVAAIAIWVVVSNDESASGSADAFSTEMYRDVLHAISRKSIVYMAFILFLYLLAWQSFAGLYPTYLVEEKGVSSTMAGLLFSLFFATGVVVKPLAGAAYDRIGMRYSLIMVLVGPFSGLMLLPFLDELWQLMIATVLVSTILGSGAITQSFLADSFAEEIRGTGLGLIRTISATLGAFGPVLFGVIADRGFFDEGYVGLAIVVAVVILLTLRAPKSNTQTVD